MSVKVTIELPDDLSRRAHTLAAAHNRRLEDAVIDWISQAVSDLDVEALPDHEVLALCESTLDVAEQAELSALLADAREGKLDATHHARLDELMADYRRGLVLKARAGKRPWPVACGAHRTTPTAKPAPIMPREHISGALDGRVRQGAHNRCGYCLSPQRLVMARLEIEHIVPLGKGGDSSESNL